MHAKALSTIAPLMLLASPARAHFHLDAPPQAINQIGNGDPQKPASLSDACPSGTSTGAITQVHAGDKIHVKITETVAHGGHYRVAFAAEESAFQFPQIAVSGNQCGAATIADPPALPVLADGLFVHDQNMANAGKVCNNSTTCETDVTVPNVAPGNYILQVIQSMTPHASAANNGAWGCFYAHCATIQVMASTANIPDGGAVVFEDAGASGTSGGNGSSSSSSDDDDSPGGSTGGSRLRSSESSASGCNVSSNGVSLGVPFFAALVAMGARRRKRREV